MIRLDLPDDVAALVAAMLHREMDEVEAPVATWRHAEDLFPDRLAPDPDDDGLTRIAGGS